MSGGATSPSLTNVARTRNNPKHIRRVSEVSPTREGLTEATPGVWERSSSRSGSRTHGLAADTRLPDELDLADKYGSPAIRSAERSKSL